MMSIVSSGSGSKVAQGNGGWRLWEKLEKKERGKEGEFERAI